MMTRLQSPQFLLPMLMGVFLVPLVLAETAAAKKDLLALPQVNAPVRLEPARRSPTLLAQQNNFSSFFQDGRMLSENQLRRRPPDPGIPVAPSSQFWQPVIFKAGGFSFWMPPGVLTEETVVLSTRMGAVSFRTLAANSENSRYVVGYADRLTDEQLRNPQALLAALTNQVISAQKFTLVRNRPITQAGVQGRELLYQSDTEVIAFRAFLRRNNAYVIGTRSPKSEGVPARKTTVFLSSFEFLSS